VQAPLGNGKTRVTDDAAHRQSHGGNHSISGSEDRAESWKGINGCKRLVLNPVEFRLMLSLHHIHRHRRNLLSGAPTLAGWHCHQKWSNTSKPVQSPKPLCSHWAESCDHVFTTGSSHQPIEDLTPYRPLINGLNLRIKTCSSTCPDLGLP